MVIKNKHVAYVGALTISMAAIGLIYAWSNYPGVGSKMASSNTETSESITDSRVASLKELVMDKEARRKRFEESAKHSMNAFTRPADAFA